jgi:hypothetical protein
MDFHELPTDTPMVLQNQQRLAKVGNEIVRVKNHPEDHIPGIMERFEALALQQQKESGARSKIQSKDRDTEERSTTPRRSSRTKKPTAHYQAGLNSMQASSNPRGYVDSSSRYRSYSRDRFPRDQSRQCLRPDRTDNRGSPAGSLILDRIDTQGNPVGTPALDRTGIQGSPVGTPAIDRTDTRGSPAGTPLDLDTTKGLPVEDSQDHALGLHQETEADRGLPTDHSRNPLTGQNPLDTIPIPGKVGHPIGQIVLIGTAPCPPGTHTLS